MIFLNCLFGIIWASFTSLVASRMTSNLSIIFPPSHCDNCKHPLIWYDLIPIISFIMLHGRCRYCSINISFKNLIVELIGGMLPLIFPTLFNNISTSIILWLLFLMSVCDIETLLIPTWSLVGLLITTTVILIIQNQFHWQTIVILVIGYLICTLINQHYHLLGGGDIDALFILGTLVEFNGMIKIVFIASLAAILWNKCISYQRENKSMPFIPFLSVGFILILG